jgi:hypothetical protein
MPAVAEEDGVDARRFDRWLLTASAVVVSVDVARVMAQFFNDGSHLTLRVFVGGVGAGLLVVAPVFAVVALHRSRWSSPTR